jgi:hypothetical protein
MVKSCRLVDFVVFHKVLMDGVFVYDYEDVLRGNYFENNVDVLVVYVCILDNL